MNNDVISFTQQLIRQQSVTPEDANCQQMISERLTPLGFSIEPMNFADTKNIWARKGQAKPLLCFAGHTDVVPTGPAERWQYPPFSGDIVDGYLWGRGAADMKSGLAAFVCACERFVGDYPTHRGSLALLITSDEEGPATHGTKAVIDVLEARQEKIDYCLIGEPSSTKVVGDTVKFGRRGTLSADIIVKGKQGHVAYPHLARNPVHLAAPAIAELASTIWDEGNIGFPPTSFQISNIQAGTGATNVIPGTCTINCNFRFSTEQTFASLKQAMVDILDRHGLDYDITWHENGQPFLTAQGELVDATVAAIKKVMAFDTELSTSGGTSDGRFIAPTGAQVVELGVINATIHQINERVLVDDLVSLEAIYYQLLVELLG